MTDTHIPSTDAAIQGGHVLPCPFCGSGEFPAMPTRTKEGDVVICVGCSALGPTRRTNADAIAAWNSRAASPVHPIGHVERKAIARAVCIATGDDFDAFGEHWVDTPCAEAADAILALTPTGSAEPEIPVEGRVMLPPDAEDIRLLRDGVLPGCPCCTGTATTFARRFPASGIYQAYVHCAHCDVEVFKNARDLDEARQLAIATWSKRPTPKPVASQSGGDHIADAGKLIGGDAVRAALPERIGRLKLGERPASGERMCHHSHYVAEGHPLYWPEMMGEYDDSDPYCLEHAIEQTESDSGWCKCMLAEDVAALSASPVAADRTGDEQRLRAVCRDMIGQAFDHYTARNGRRMSIEGDDGEKCWIVPFDAFEAVRRIAFASPVAKAVEAEDATQAGLCNADASPVDDEQRAREVLATIVEEDEKTAGVIPTSPLGKSTAYYIRDAQNARITAWQAIRAMLAFASPVAAGARQ